MLVARQCKSCPTTHFEGFSCSGCGHQWGLVITQGWNYCPYCGAALYPDDALQADQPEVTQLELPFGEAYDEELDPGTETGEEVQGGRKNTKAYRTGGLSAGAVSPCY